MHKKSKYYKKLVTFLAIIVAFSTSYALILPAIALEKGHIPAISMQETEPDNTDTLSETSAAIETIPETPEPALASDTEDTAKSFSAEDTEDTAENFSAEDTEDAAKNLSAKDTEDAAKNLSAEDNAQAPALADETNPSRSSADALDADEDSSASKEASTAAAQATSENTSQDADAVTTLTAKGKDYEISAEYGADAQIPDGAKLAVKELTGKKAAALKEDVTKALELDDAELLSYERYFDISILADNKKVEPQAEIAVTISLEDLEKEDQPQVVNVGKEQADLVDSESDGKDVKTTMEESSVYAVVTTLEKTVLASDGNNYKITVSCGPKAGIPKDAQLTAEELSGDAYEEYLGRTAVAMEAADFAYARIFDITIIDNNGEEIQPSAPVQVNIEMLDGGFSGDNFSVVHFEKDMKEMSREELVQMDAQAEGNVVSFNTDSFSAYAIVEGPSAIPLGWTQFKTQADFEEYMSAGVYIGTTSGYYMTDETAVGNKDANTTGIVKTTPSQNYPPTDKAALYYAEKVVGSTDQYYFYCKDDNGNKKYVHNTGDANLTLSDESGKTAFTVTIEKNSGRFRFHNGDRYWNMWNGANGNHIAAWTTANDGGNYFYVWHHDGTTGDPYGLDGKTYGLMNWNESASGRALMAESSNTNFLDALALTVLSKTGNNSDKLFVPDDSDISMWTFHWVGDDKYHLTTFVDGSTKYLKVTSSGLSLVDAPDDSCKLQVIPGSGTHAGEISLKAGNATLTYTGKIAQGFKTGGSAGTEWLRLVEMSELTSDYFLTHSAAKVSVSDPGVTNGSHIIVYTRVWNDETKKYEFYAVDHDGSLVRCYESGDDIQWVGPMLNSMLWDFAEYYQEGTTDPNHYYDLYNQYSEKYLAPQITGGQTLSDTPIGLNLNGRKDGKYYSEILAWDDPSYAYTGLKADVEAGKIVACPKGEADDFYFAIVQDIPVDDTLHTVATVDSAKYGITMKITDFGTRKEMSDFLGSDAGGAVNNTVPDLLSTHLDENGYPITTKDGNKLSDWFADAKEVNHLFIQSTYNATGYYEYDATENFASLQGNDFKVYREIGTVNSSGVHYQHGQFFPYNDLKAGVFASTSPKNLTTAGGAALPNSDPRKYEQLYLVQNTNYYYGMEIEASFTQTPNGLDDWGHDIIYEFTGDDDFWLYVDGELIIDLGGIHNALSGSVNYKTGDVYVNGVHHTLRELFENNYIKRNPNATSSEVNNYLSQYFDEGSTIFKDYTTHTMKIFYLERGAGAANLHMRFNLASILPGTVELTKALGGVDPTEADSITAEFPYQIKYKKKGSDEELYLSNEVPNDPERNKDFVFYKNTINPVEFHPSLEVGGITYKDVFMMKPGETAVINFPTFGDDKVEIDSYSIVECGVNTDVFSKVKANGAVLSGSSGTGYPDNRKDYGIDYATTKDRASVAYTNEVKPEAIRTLTIRKQLYDETGVNIISDQDATPFTFRLFMGTEYEEDLPAASMHTYHVKDSDHHYCTWDLSAQQFVSTDKTNFSDLSSEQKTAASFHTSINGAISKIPPGYYLEIRNVLAGTRFKVLERPSDMPDGYYFQQYDYYKTGLENPRTGIYNNDVAGVSDTVVANQDPHVDVRNLKGWGLRVNKIWKDANYMTSRAATYFGIFVQTDEGLQLVDNTLYQMPYTAKPQTLYWYFKKLPVENKSNVNDYLIREVKIASGEPDVNDDGLVTNVTALTYSPIEDGGTLEIRGIQKGETESADYNYTVNYEVGALSQYSNVRVDTVTNDRPGIILKKEDWSGKALAGAEFTLKDSNDNLIGTFTSDDNGLITTAFLSENKQYTLTETKAPKPYHGMESSMRIVCTHGTVSVEGVEASYYTLEQSTDNKLATITIKNHPFTLKAVKKDGDTQSPLSDVEFALHKQHTVGEVTQFDTNPMPGYETLKTDGDGYILNINESLPAGTYELREKQPKAGYVSLPAYIHFTINDLGKVTLGTVPDGVTLSEETGTDGTLHYLIEILNYQKTNVLLKKEDNSGHPLTGAKFQLCKYESTWETVADYSEIDMSSLSEINLLDLRSGRYRLTETHAPDGYILLDKEIYFNLSFSNTGAAVITLTNETGSGVNTNTNVSASGTTITVKNTPGAALPSTGGPGIMPLMAAGFLLLALAGTGAVLLRHRKGC